MSRKKPAMPRKKHANRGLSEREAEYEAPLPYRIDLQLGPGGRVVIPAVYRKAMQVQEGDRLMASVVDGELRLITPIMSVRKVQKMVRETIPPDVDLVQSLLDERRREYEKEFGDGSDDT